MLGRTFAIIAATVFIIPTGLTSCRKDEPRPARDASASPESQPRAAQAAAPTPATPASAGSEATSPADARSTETPFASDVKPDDKAAAPQTSGSSAERSGGAEGAGAADRPGDGETAGSVLREVEREILMRWTEIQSVSATMVTTFERTEKPLTSQRGRGTYDCLKRDGRLLIRTFHYNAISAENDNEEIPWIITGERYTKVSDGQFLYTMREAHDGTKVTKRYAGFPRVMPIGGAPLLALLRRLDHLEALPDTAIDGVPVRAFRGTARGGEPRNVRVLLDLEAGIMRELVIERPLDHSTFTFTISDAKFNVEFPADHFTFTPPEGLTIEDQTQPKPVGSPTPDDTTGPSEPLAPEEGP